MTWPQNPCPPYIAPQGGREPGPERDGGGGWLEDYRAAKGIWTHLHCTGGGSCCAHASQMFSFNQLQRGGEGGRERGGEWRDVRGKRKRRGKGAKIRRTDWSVQPTSPLHTHTYRLNRTSIRVKEQDDPLVVGEPPSTVARIQSDQLHRKTAGLLGVGRHGQQEPEP